MYNGRLEAHRGVCDVLPENTIPAFLAAKYQGYDVIELDPSVTKDGVVVVFHDKDIARTLRFPNGRFITENYKITELTYDELMTYSAGARLGEKYHNVKVPTLKEVYDTVPDILIKIDNKIFRENFGAENRDRVLNLIKSLGVENRTIFTVNNTGDADFIHSIFPHSEIDYDGALDEETAKHISSLTNGKTVFWLPLDCKLNGWVKVPFVNDEYARIAKKYGKLGLWLATENSQLEEAERYGADIVETTGVLKPKNVIGGFVDCHLHSNYSHDSKNPPENVTETVKKVGLAGYTLTDHFDSGDSFWRDNRDKLTESFEYCRNIGFDSNPFAMGGIEIGEGVKDTENYRAMINRNKYDIINGSCHFSSAVGFSENPISQIDFKLLTDEQIDDIFSSYLRNIMAMIDYEYEINVVCHLTYPLRYICAKNGRKLDLSKYDKEINTILKMVVAHGLALEVNTSGIDADGTNILFPNLDILKKYYDYGGRIITLGSDAHKSERIGYAFNEVWQDLKKIGFDRLYYFRNGIPVSYTPFDEE